MKKFAALFFLVFTLRSMEQKEKLVEQSTLLPHLNVVILLDSGDEDGKGGVFTDLAAAIRNKVPIIASSCLMKIFIDNKDRKDDLPIKTLFAELLDANQWSLFKNTSSDFVIALPNNFWPYLGKIDKEKLALIGLNKNILTQIAPGEFEYIFKNAPAVPINMDSLENLFLINPNIRKRIYLTGHGYFDERMKGGGSDTFIAQLTISQYQRFLNFLNTIETDILYVDSCYSGGLNLLTPYLEKVDTASKQLLNYFIIIGGLTDAVTLASYNNSNYKKFFKAINEFFSPKGPSMKNPLRSIVQHVWGESLNNIPSVRFPGSLHYFKAIDVDGKTEIITQAKVIAQILETEKGLKQVLEIGELSAQIKDKQEREENTTTLVKEFEKKLKELTQKRTSVKYKPESIIDIYKENTKIILLYPLMFPISLRISANYYFNNDKNFPPSFVSMIPGNAIHYIKEIDAQDEYINRFFKSFYTLKLASTKIFIIKSLLVKNSTPTTAFKIGLSGTEDDSYFKHIFIKITENGGFVILKHKKGYYKATLSYFSAGKPDFNLSENHTIFTPIAKKEALFTIIEEVKNLKFMPETIQFLGGRHYLERQLNKIMHSILPTWKTHSLLE